MESVDGHSRRRRGVEAVALEEASRRVVGIREQVEHACGGDQGWRVVERSYARRVSGGGAVAGLRAGPAAHRG
eukprot:scaffold141310_cov21-Tisochrysis_lutea.AAC.2